MSVSVSVSLCVCGIKKKRPTKALRLESEKSQRQRQNTDDAGYRHLGERYLDDEEEEDWRSGGSINRITTDVLRSQPKTMCFGEDSEARKD